MNFRTLLARFCFILCPVSRRSNQYSVAVVSGVTQPSRKSCNALKRPQGGQHQASHMLQPLPLFPTRRLGGQRGTRPQPPRVLPSSPCSSCGRKKRLKMGKQSHFKRFVVYKSKGHGILTIVILADFWDYNSKKARSTEITRSYGYKCDELKRSEEKEPSPWNL